MKSIFKRILWIGFWVLIGVFTFVLIGAIWLLNKTPEIPERMLPHRIVNDYAEIFSEAQRQQLEDSLVVFEKTISTKIVVVAVDNFDYATPKEYAEQILDEWGVGQDNGVILLFKPRNEYGVAKIYLQCWHGIEKEALQLLRSNIALCEQDENFYAAVVGVISVGRTDVSKGIGEIGRGGGRAGGGGVGHAQQIPEPMSPARLVNDYAGLLSAAERQQLEDSLVAFDRATSTQIAVVTVNDLEGIDPAEYATQILHEWGVGQKDKDNGVVLLLKPRNEHGKSEVFIAVGYGLEGVLPDITAGRIINGGMIPFLSSDPPDYYSAIALGIIAIRETVKEEYKEEDSSESVVLLDWSSPVVWIICLGFLILIGFIIWVIITIIKAICGNFSGIYHGRGDNYNDHSDSGGSWSDDSGFGGFDGGDSGGGGGGGDCGGSDD